jgi:dissimilatory sulfite reductase (desulfoviridin) alpha/beta subunit
VEAAPPVWDAAACQGCLGCSQACPAGCVSLERQGARLFLGGKLGRHPRLAVPAGQYADPARALAAMDEAVNRYLNEARPGERFAAWHQRVAS